MNRVSRISAIDTDGPLIGKESMRVKGASEVKFCVEFVIPTL